MINSTYKKANRLFYTILLVWVVQLGWAQIFPVQVNSNVLPPYLSSISKYSTTSDQKYLVNIFTSDLSVVNRQVKLKLYLQGNGINAQSAPVVVGASPLFINGGESLQLNNIDLAPYFELQNLQGINPLQYSGVLPQGNYNFCVEVYDFVTNQPISQKSCTFFYFIYNEPPLLNSPFNHEVILFQDPQNIIFTWTPRHINATNIEYQFELIELLDNQAPSNYAFIVGAPVWQETVNNTILNYNFNLPQLAAGKKYAWRVKAVSQPGFGEEAIFNNNGYSEIYDFIYAGNCSAPEFVLAQSTSATQAKIMWQTNTNHLANVVQYRKQGTQEWFNAPVANGQALLFDLEPTATYEFQVGGTCLGNITTFSAINQFTQPAKDQVAINCGIAPAIDLTNVTLYSEEIQKDMVFMAADYAIHITESQGVGTYTGKGWTRAPYLKNIKIAVEFENIKLNSELKLVEGEVKAQYDPTWSNIVDVNQVIDTLDDIFDTLQESTDVHTHQVNFVIQDTTNIVVQNGQIIITTPQGTTGATFDFDQGENTTITDSNGTVYNVDPNGNVTLVQQGIGVPNSSNTENLNSNGEVTALSNVGAKVVFKNNTASTAFDDSSANYSNAPPKLAKQYKTIKDGSGNDYPFYYKAVINNEDGLKTTDLVTAEITITDTLIKPKDIVFNLKGQKVEEESSSTVGNVTTKVLKVPAFTTVGENELLALVKIKTDSLKQKVIGAMTVIPIKNVGTVNVTLVPVNGATVSSNDIAAIKNIYSGAGVALNITIAPNHTDATTTLECGTSGWIANYTTEQNAFIDRYKAAKTISDTEYYLFVTKGIQPSRPLSGFMPLHRQYGFVFSDETRAGETKQTNSSGLATIIAHELGHGVFELEHPWEKYDYTVGAYTTNWLMDYASGSKLSYRHWQQISHPKTKLYLFQGDSSGEQVLVSLANLPEKYKNIDKSFSFLTPSGKIVTIPSNSKEVTFSSLDPYYKVSSGEITGNYAPLGSLLRFKLGDNKVYSFKGYGNSYVYECSECSENDKFYVDKISSQLNSNLKNIIVGIPYYQENEIYLRFVIYPKKPNHSYNTNNNNYGDILSDFAIIDELNSGDKLNQNYFSLFVDDDYSTKDINFGTLSQFSLQYLESYKYIAGKNSPLSPIVISSALLFTQLESYESNITCNVNSIQDGFNLILKQIHDAVKPTAAGPPATIKVVLSSQQGILRSKELGDKYNLLRNGLQNIQDNNQTIISINSKLSIASSASQIITIINSYDNCNLELINFENRLRAIKILEPANEEEAIIKLINTIYYNGQTALLLDELFKNNSKLFKKLWNRLDFLEFHEYINKVTEFVKLSSDTTVENSFTFSLNLNSLSVSGNDFEYTFNNNGTLTVTLEDIGIVKKTFTFNSLNEVIRVTIPLENSFLKWEENQVENVTLELPAYYLAYLIRKKHIEQNMFVARVLGNLVAIVTAIPTGGQSITAVQAISLSLATADLIMALNEDKIKLLNGGTDFIEFWNTITLIDGAVGLGRLGISITKTTINGVDKLSKIKIDYNILKQGLTNLDDRGKAIINKLQQLPALLKRMGQLPVEVAFNTRILSQVEQAILSTKFTSSTNVLSFENWIIAKVANKKIFEIDFASSGGFARLTDLRASIESSDNIIGTLDNIRYVDNTGRIKEAYFNIIKKIDGTVYVVVQGAGNLAQSLTGALKNTYDDIIRFGGSAVENNGVLKLLSKNGDEVAQISNGKILPTKYFDDVAHSGATPIGQPANGYQVFKKGDDLVVKRMPDKSAYSSSELTELTQNSKAHTLERHGHDVTDEALIKRANSGIAPDGSYIGNNPLNPPKPPYSSKFETPQQLQKALSNTKPGTSAFNNTPAINGRKTVIHELTDGTTYGKGVPKDGSTFQQSTKVRAGYEEVSPGNWQLVTMFPDF